MARGTWFTQGSWLRRVTVLLVLPATGIAWMGRNLDRGEWLLAVGGLTLLLGVERWGQWRASRGRQHRG